MKQKIFFLLAIFLLFINLSTLNASTIKTIFDVGRAEMFWYNGNFYGGNYGEAMIVDNELSQKNRMTVSFVQFDISELYNLVYDNIYLSLTELCSSEFAKDSVKLSSYIGDGISFGSNDILKDWNQPVQYITTFTTQGVGGNQIIISVLDIIENYLNSGYSYIGFRLEDATDSNNKNSAFLGRNYNSGSPTQYYASSLYEYPTLIVTEGDDITPFELLPPKPVTDEPTSPPINPPTPVPEANTLFLISIGLCFIVWRNRKLSKNDKNIC